MATSEDRQQAISAMVTVLTNSGMGADTAGRAAPSLVDEAIRRKKTASGAPHSDEQPS